MKVAVIDIGTNTFNLLIAEIVTDDSLKILYKTRIPVKIGQGGINNRLISQEAFERGIEALVQYKKIIDEHAVEKIIAYATSAVRDAKNGCLFVKEAGKRAGIKIDVISGDKEAELIYYGVRQAVVLPDEPVLIMDIGGGSTEFIIAGNKNVFWKKSFRLGVSRIVEKFNPSDPVLSEEIERLTEFFTAGLYSLFRAARKFPVSTLIGSAGSFETFAEIIVHKFYSPDILKDKTFYRFNMDDFHDLHRWLLKSTLLERLNTKGLVQFRADTIVTAGILVNAVLQKLPIEKMLLSKYSLREGAMFRKISFFADFI